jgi:uncharacterized protein YjcR
MAKKRVLSVEDAKVIAYDLYMNTDLSQKEICERVIITEATFTSWKKKYDWEIQKQAFSITANNIVANLMKKAHELSQQDDVEADKIIKLVKSIESLTDKKITVSNIINVFKDFTTFAFEVDPEAAKSINRLQKAYVEYKIGNA